MNSTPPQSKTVLTIVVLGTRPDARMGGVSTAIAGFLEMLDQAEVQWTFLPTHDARSVLGKVVPWLTTMPRLAVLLIRRRGDLVWLHCGAGPSMFRQGVVALLARLLGTQVLMHLHSPTVAKWTDTALRRSVFKLFLTGATRVAVVAPWWKGRLEQAGVRKPVDVIGNVVEKHIVARAQQPQCAGSSDGRVQVLTACRLVSGKGVDRLLVALADLPKHVHLVVCGDGPERTRLVNLAASLGVTDRVVFDGWVTADVLAERREQSDVFSLVSTHDSFGMGYIEAMAVGLPVIGACWQAIPDVVQHGGTGLLVDPDDNRALVDAVGVLSASANTRADMGKAGQEAVRTQWAPSSRMETVRRVFQSIIGGET